MIIGMIKEHPTKQSDDEASPQWIYGEAAQRGDRPGSAMSG